MMKCTEREAIPDHGFTLRMRIGDDVRSAEELFMPKSTEGALMVVCLEHAFPEGALMEAHTHHRGDVASSCVNDIVGNFSRGLRSSRDERGIIYRNTHRHIRRVIPNNIDGPGREILADRYTVEINQRESQPHRGSETLIVWVSGIGSAVAIPEEVVRTEPVVVRTFWSGRDGEWPVLHHLGLEDALWAQQGNSDSLKLESLEEQSVG